MAERGAVVSQDELENLVRDALLHIYDVTRLVNHPLAQLVGAPPGSSATARSKLLVRSLLDAIESFRPPPGTPGDSRAWRNYRLLELRYVGGMSASDVISQLGISKSQYQRDHARALEAITRAVCERWHLGQSRLRATVDPGSRESLALTEAEQLACQMSPDNVDVAGMLGELLALLRPVAEENRIALALRMGRDLPAVCGDRVALRQVFLGLLNAALGHRACGAVDVSVGLSDGGVDITITASSGLGLGTSGVPDRSRPEIEVARRFAEVLGGKLEIGSSGQTGAWWARVVFPVAQQPVVLVLDNHPDFIDLVARYLADDNWRVVGAQDVRQAQPLVLELRPSAILLDVMLPGQDGWDLLLALKSRPETRQIPVIVCSVLYEPHVARALGAVDYLAKPITQAELVEALAPYRRGRCEPGAAC